MSRSIEDIARDIVETRAYVNALQMVNVFGASNEKMIDLQIKSMEAEKKLNSLMDERKAFVEGK